MTQEQREEMALRLVWTHCDCNRESCEGCPIDRLLTILEKGEEEE